MATSTLSPASPDNSALRARAAGFAAEPEAGARNEQRRTPLTLAGLTSGLLLQVVLIHLIDQDWFAFAKDPSYVQTGYTLTEILGVLTAAALLVRRDWWLWLAAFSVAAGPFMGFLVSRSTGLPHYTDDIGNWTEPLGVASLLVEASVMLIAGRFLLGAWRRQRA